MSLNITQVPLNAHVIMVGPDNYKLRGQYKGYLPGVQRHEFLIKLGNGDGTRVLLSPDTFTRYKLEIEDK